MLGEYAGAAGRHEADLDDAGLDGGQQLLRLRGEQEQQGVRRRLLQCLEKSVLRLHVHALRIHDDAEFPAVRRSGAADHFFEKADRARIVAIIADGDAAALALRAQDDGPLPFPGLQRAARRADHDIEHLRREVLMPRLFRPGDEVGVAEPAVVTGAGEEVEGVVGGERHGREE